MSKELTGAELIGQKVEMWQDSKKYGTFRSVATIIEHRKRRMNGDCNYLLRFKGTKNQGEYFDMWCRRSHFKLIESSKD